MSSNEFAGCGIEDGPDGPEQEEKRLMNSTLPKLWEATRHMANSFLDRLPALILSIVVFIAFYGLSHIAARAIEQAVSKRRQNLALVFARLTAGVTILFGLLIAISIVAPSFQASDLIKILGIGGVAIGFAFQNILQNFLAGLLLLWSEPFRVGDEIKVDAFEGRVEEIQARATIIRTYDEREVVIPNADLFTHSVIVNTAMGSRRWQYDLDVKKGQNLEQLKKVLMTVVGQVPGVLPDPGPEALIVDATPDTVKLRILWSTQDSRQHQMLESYDQVLTAVVDALDGRQAADTRRAAA
jgi:small conductance mechanosensitive channel